MGQVAKKKNKESARALSLAMTPGGAASVASQAEALAKSLNASGLKEAERLTNLLVNTNVVYLLFEKFDVISLFEKSI